MSADPSAVNSPVYFHSSTSRRSAQGSSPNGVFEDEPLQHVALASAEREEVHGSFVSPNSAVGGALAPDGSAQHPLICYNVPTKASDVSKPTGKADELTYSPATGERQESVSQDEDSVMCRRTSVSRRRACCVQFGMTVMRVLLLMRRSWCAALLEVFIPIAFVIGSIVIWAIFGSTDHGAMSYFGEVANPNFTTQMKALRATFCSNSSDAAVAQVLPRCSDAASLYCPIGLGIPSGFCYDMAYTYFATRGVLSMFEGVTGVLPSLDDVIALHWINLDSRFVEMPGAVGSLTHGGKLYLTPNSTVVQGLAEKLRASSQYFDLVFGGVLDSASEASSLAANRDVHNEPIWGYITVNAMQHDAYDISISLNASSLPRTTTIVNKYYMGGLDDEAATDYLLSGFVTLQDAISRYYINEVLGQTVQPPGLTATAMPTAAYTRDVFLSFGNQFVPIIFTLGFLYPVSQMVKRVVLEKELRIREAMLIMGLSELIMYLAWFLVYLVQYAAISLVITILVKVTYLKRSNFGAIFFLFWMYSIDIVILAGLIATFFSKSRLSSVLSPIIYFLTAIPIFAVSSIGPSGKLGLMILPPGALSVGIGLLLEHELDGGFTSQDLVNPRDYPTFMAAYGFLIFDAFFYLALMVYLDQVIPKTWGTTKNVAFCIIEPFRWCFCRHRAQEEEEAAEEDGRAADGIFEEVKDEPAYSTRIVGLRKKFKRGGKSFLAVNNLYWGMREGEISVLLGHNGAGKSTTMNMMTGMIEADAGDCIIYGKSIRHQLAAARREIGYCPQHNILWPELTCREHLSYFAALKGLRGSLTTQMIDDLLIAVDLESKADNLSKHLSGGQKRKLSVAISFVGGSRLVFLDEPTAGMDVGTRRHTWALLKRMSKTRTVLLSTHFMDEADLLGSTIGIMSNGRLQCSGSSMFLKSKLGFGYVLTLSLLPRRPHEPIERLVRSVIPEANSLGGGAGEISLQLPTARRADFSALLTQLENDDGELGIKDSAITATTLEEVFLKVAKRPEGSHEVDETHADDGGASAERSSDSSDAASSSSPIGDGSAASTAAAEEVGGVWDVPVEEREVHIVLRQLHATLAKRLWNSIRDRRVVFFQIICPVISVLLAMLFNLIRINDSPTITLSDRLYPDAVEVVLAHCDGTLNTTYPFVANGYVMTLDRPDSVALSNYLLETYGVHTKSRYGAVFCADPSLDGRNSFFYNSSVYHELPIRVASYYQGVLQRYVSEAAEMVTKVRTMPQTAVEKAVSKSITGYMISVIVTIPFTFIPSTFVGWIVKERECKARHLQNVSGLRFSVYWISNFIFDFCSYLVTMFVVVIIFVIFQRKEFISPENAGATILAFVLYGLSGISSAYAVSFAFNEHSAAQNLTMLINFILGFLLLLCVAVLEFQSSTETVAKALRWVFRIVPSFCCGEVLLNLSNLQTLRAYGSSSSAFTMSVVGWPCVYMALELPLFMGITLFIDHPTRRQRAQRLFHNPNATPEALSDEDEDVVQERKDVLQSPDRQDDLVRVMHLRKVYNNKKVAVRNLTFGVQPGEVFGFLGTNGAGKTTTISILCQEFYPTSGHAAICGYDIVKDSRQALRCIGYCPQFDATLDLLTVEEHLQLYAGIRGIPRKTQRRVLQAIMKLCELVKYRKTKSKELSGGNRRKLSVAISLIGGPRVVFLDEPSAGMDPVARRGLWTAIQTVSQSSAIVLTTHHLEEVEALADRVAIMVDGSLRCVGNKTHLKAKFGTGIEVNVRVGEDSDAVKEAVMQFFTHNFADGVFREYHSERFTFELAGGTKLSKIFGLLEANLLKLRVMDYNVSQTSIEQVFMRISVEAEKKQEEEALAGQDNKPKHRWCCGCCD